MIKNFKIKNFKCFSEFEIKNFGKVNIFLGANNVGKSTLLESIFGYACGKNLSPMIEHTLFRLFRDRDQNLYSLTEKVLNSFNDKKKLEFSFEGELENNEKQEYRYEINPSSIFGEINTELNNNSSFSEIGETSKISDKYFFKIILKEGGDRKVLEKVITFPLVNNIPTNEPPFLNANRLDINSFKDSNSITKIYSFLKRDSEKFQLFVSELNKAFKNDIEKIDMFPYPDGTPAPISVKITGKEFMPIYEFGEGMQKWFSVIGNQMIYRNYIHCIEEIGDMLHPDAQGILGVNLSEMADKYNNQVFATTQSLEFVENYLESLSEKNKDLLDDVRIVTLKKVEGKIRARVLNGSEALELLNENSMELR